MPAANFDILIEQGATYDQEFIWKDSEGTGINLAGYSARMQIRQVKSEAIILNLTDEDGITLNYDGNGSIRIFVSATDTSELTTCSQARYDLELENSDGTVTRLLQGAVTISGEVTR